MGMMSLEMQVVKTVIFYTRPEFVKHFGTKRRENLNYTNKNLNTLLVGKTKCASALFVVLNKCI